MYRVLIADDEPMIKKSLRSLIEHDLQDFQLVAEAKNGLEARELVQEHQPDIVITDIRMPLLDGLELLSWMDEHAFSSECIIISGYGEFAYAQQALRFGVTEYLLKPLDSEYFIHTMNKLKERLENRVLQSSKRRELLLTYKSYAEEAAKAIWHLNEEAIELEINRIEQDIQTYSEADLPEIALLYYDYFTFLEGTLRTYGEMQFTFARFTDQQESRKPQVAVNLCTIFRHKIEQAAAHIRQTRNWHHHYLMTNEAKQFMQTHIANADFNLEQAAAYFDISPNYFSQLLKKNTGMSFKQYLTHLRMEQAKSLLREPFIKVYEVSHLVGIEDYSHFSKTFKKMVGCSPSEYRGSVL